MSSLLSLGLEARIEARDVYNAFPVRSDRYRRTIAQETTRIVIRNANWTKRRIWKSARRLVNTAWFDRKKLDKIVHTNPRRWKVEPSDWWFGFSRSVELSNIPIGWRSMPQLKIRKKKVPVRGARKKAYRYHVFDRVAREKRLAAGVWLATGGKKPRWVGDPQETTERLIGLRLEGGKVVTQPTAGMVTLLRKVNQKSRIEAEAKRRYFNAMLKGYRRINKRFS